MFSLPLSFRRREGLFVALVEISGEVVWLVSRQRWLCIPVNRLVCGLEEQPEGGRIRCSLLSHTSAAQVCRRMQVCRRVQCSARNLRVLDLSRFDAFDWVLCTVRVSHSRGRLIVACFYITFSNGKMCASFSVLRNVCYANTIHGSTRGDLRPLNCRRSTQLSI